MGKGIGIQLIDDAENGDILDLKIEARRDMNGKIIQGIMVGSTLNQNKALILITQPGEFKFRPEIGVGIEDSLLSDDLLEYRHKIREEFERDGLKVTKVDFYENKPFNVEADYE